MWSKIHSKGRWAVLVLIAIVSGCTASRNPDVHPSAHSFVLPREHSIHSAGKGRGADSLNPTAPQTSLKLASAVETNQFGLALAGGPPDKTAPKKDTDEELPAPRQVPSEPDGTLAVPVGKDAPGTNRVIHTIEDYVWLALGRNPEIRAAVRQAGAESQTIPQVTSLPDPVLTNTWWPISENSPQTASGKMPYSLTISQRLPWCGKLQARGEVAGFETQIALARVAQTQLRVAEAVKLTYYDVYYNKKALGITKESEKLLDLYIRVAEARYKVGQVSQQDVLRIQVEQGRIRDQLVMLQRESLVAQADLARLLSVAPESEIKTVDSLSLPPIPSHIEQLYQIAYSQRPELRERLLAISRDERKVQLAELDYYPDVTVGFGWNAISTNNALSPVANGKDNLGVMVSLNLPVWQEKLRGGVWEARDRAAASADRYEAERDETFRLIRRLTIQARALEEQITLLRDDIIPRSEQTLRVSSADYRVGKISVLQLLDNWGQLLRFQVQLARLESSLGQAIASLERALGMLLSKWPEHHGVNSPSPKNAGEKKESDKEPRKEDGSGELPMPRNLPESIEQPRQ